MPVLQLRYNVSAKTFYLSCNTGISEVNKDNPDGQAIVDCLTPVMHHVHQCVSGGESTFQCSILADIQLVLDPGSCPESICQRTIPVTCLMLPSVTFCFNLFLVVLVVALLLRPL